jgi:hypothetical protein
MYWNRNCPALIIVGDIKGCDALAGTFGSKTEKRSPVCTTSSWRAADTEHMRPQSGQGRNGTLSVIRTLRPQLYLATLFANALHPVCWFGSSYVVMDARPWTPCTPCAGTNGDVSSINRIFNYLTVSQKSSVDGWSSSCQAKPGDRPKLNTLPHLG